MLCIVEICYRKNGVFWLRLNADFGGCRCATVALDVFFVVGSAQFLGALFGNLYVYSRMLHECNTHFFGTSGVIDVVELRRGPRA